MATSSCVIAAVVATLFLATCAIAATPPYKCFGFSGASNGKRSHDKSGIRQRREIGDAAKCPGQGCTAIEPTGDINREVGQPYEAYCLFDSTYINVANVTFQHRGRTRQEQYNLPHTVVNASAIKVTVTHEEAESYSLWCNLNSQYLCSRTVKVGYRPQNVENLTCVSKNWSDLNCTWTVPNNPLQVQYNVTECPPRQTHPNGCYWPYELFSLSVKDEWIAHFNASNKLEKGVVFKNSISTHESVLPNAVEELEAHVDGPNNVTLSWILPHPMDTFKRILCEAAYRERLDGDVSENVPWRMVDRWPVEPDRWDREENFNKTISGLHAYKQYDFRVRIHTGFGAVRPHMWSEAVILTKRTSALYPTVAPKTTKGAFEVEETLSYRDIYVSWQKVDSLYHNALNFHYKINAYDALNNRLIAKDEAEVDIKDSYAKFSNMEKDVTYRFEIIPMNDEGPPQKESVKALVLVPGSADLLKVPTFFRVIAYSGANRTVYSIRWRVDNPEAQNVDTVTLYWCKKDKYEERCLNKLEWQIVQNPNLNVKNLTNLEETSLYMFGISLNSQNSSSGIKWITCIASYGNHPPPLEQFEVSQVSSHEVVLEWSLDCKAKAAEPIGFNISYCVGTEDSQECPPGAEKIFQSIHDEAALEHKVGNLHPHTNYIFNIAILTQIGLSKWSKSEHVLTKPDKPSGPPQQFEVVESGQTWVSLSWKLPIVSERNGEVVEYVIMWELEGKKKTVPANTSSEYTQFNVTDLDPYTNYTFEVTACTRIRVSDESCGSQYAPVKTKTRIGAPSKIDDISQVDEVVKWDHDCSNGPSCFYQLLYTINSTEHIHETEPNVASINIRDLNITCTKAEKEIVVGLRAVTYNETKQKLFGPWKKESVTCYLTGSYSHDHVPSISDNLQIILVQLPQNNQYNTVINLLKIPESGDAVSPRVEGGVSERSFGVQSDFELLRLIKATTRLGREGAKTKQHFLGSRTESVGQHDVNRYSLVVESSDHLQGFDKVGDRNVGREGSEAIEGMIVEPDLYRHSQVSGNSVRYFLKLHGDDKSIGHNYINLNTLIMNTKLVGNSQPDYEKDNVLHSQNNVDFGEESDRLPLEDNHHNENSYSPQRTHRLAHKLSCPLLNLMKSEGSEVRVNASDTKFEFNIKAVGNPYSILKTLYQHSVQDNKPFANERTDLVDVDSKGYGQRKILSDGEGTTQLEDAIIMSSHELSEADASRAIRSNRRKVSSSSSFVPSPSDQDIAFNHKQSEFEGAGVNDSQLKLGRENETLAALSTSENGTVAVSDISKSGRIVDSVEAALQHHIFIPTNSSRKNLSSEGPSSKIEAQPSVVSVQMPSEDHRDAAQHSQGSIAQAETNSTPIHADARIHDRDRDHLNGDFKMLLQEDLTDDKIGVTESLEQPQPSHSMIYRIIGSYNGNFDRSASQRIDEQVKKQFEVISNTDEDHIAFSNRMSEHDVSPFFGDYQEVSVADGAHIGSKVRNQLSQEEYDSSLRPNCPFAELIKSKGVHVSVTSPGDGKFELNVQGNGNFYDLLKSLYDDPISKSKSSKKGSGSAHRFRSSSTSVSAPVIRDPPMEMKAFDSNKSDDVELIYSNDNLRREIREGFTFDEMESAESERAKLILQASPSSVISERARIHQINPLTSTASTIEPLLDSIHDLHDETLQQKTHISSLYVRDLNQKDSEFVTPRDVELSTDQLVSQSDPDEFSHPTVAAAVQFVHSDERKPVSTPQYILPLKSVIETSTEHSNIPKDTTTKMFVLVQ